MDKASMVKAIEGSTFVAHTASPILFKVENEDEVIKPAVDGTLAVMEGCKAAGVKRCVVISSTAAVLEPSEDKKPANKFYDASIWSDETRTTGLSAYGKSKTLAEKAAW